MQSEECRGKREERDGRAARIRRGRTTGGPPELRIPDSNAVGASRRQAHPGRPEGLHNDLQQYLFSIGRIDEHFPESPDIEELWPKIAQSYLPDGIREFAGYPIVSLAWMMYTGMGRGQRGHGRWRSVGLSPEPTL